MHEILSPLIMFIFWCHQAFVPSIASFKSALREFTMQRIVSYVLELLALLLLVMVVLAI